MSAECYLKIFKARQYVEIKEIASWPITIGRNAKASVVVQGEGVTDVFARIDKGAEGHILSCLDPDARLQVNGRAVNRTPVKSGDVITIDTADIAFYLKRPSMTVVPPLFGKVRPTLPSEEPVPSAPPPPPSPPAPQASPAAKLPPKGFLPDEKTLVGGVTLPPSPPAPPPRMAVDEERTVKIPVRPTPDLVETVTNNPVLPPDPERSVTKTATAFRPAKTAKGFQGAAAAVEILVLWNEKVLDTFHFDSAGAVVVGGHEDCDIRLPIFANPNVQHRLVTLGPQVKIHLASRMTCFIDSPEGRVGFEELTGLRRVVNEGAGETLVLNKDETAVVDFPGSPLTLSLRIVRAASIPLLAPLFDLSVSELTGLIMSVFVTALMSFYVSVNAPKESGSIVQMVDPIRTAQLIYEEKKELPPPPPPPEKKEEKPPEPKKEIVELKPLVKPKEQAPKLASRRTKPKGVDKPQTGAAQRIRPKNLPEAPPKVTSIRQGEAKKIGEKPGASAATKDPDLSKVGVLSVLGNDGYRTKIDQAATGLGVLQGWERQATGGVGESEDILGKGIGSALKDDGAGSTGLSTMGIDDVGTKGLGSGDQKIGDGGLGDRVRPDIKLGGEEEDFLGKIDREAIRRVIKANENQIRNCYESELNKNPTLTGKVMVQWKLGLGGAALDAKVIESSLKSRNVEDCLIRRLKTWKFPEPPPGVEGEITYPFNFVSTR